MTIVYIIIGAFIFFSVALALAIIIGASRGNRQWDESSKRIEDELMRQRVDGAEKWKARVGE